MEKENTFKDLYLKVNYIDENKELNIYDKAYVDYIDILSSKQLKLFLFQDVNCICKDPKHFNDYYNWCPKCLGEGVINLLGEELICNHCHGTKVVQIHKCSVCNGEGSYLQKKEIPIELHSDINDGDTIVIKNKGKQTPNQTGDLILTIKINDLNHYEIKGNDVYYKKIIYFTEDEVKNKKAKEVKTVKGITKITVNQKEKFEVVKIEKHGLNDGDFYVACEKQLPPLKGEDLYINVILDKEVNNFYISKKHLYDSNKVKKITYFKPLINDDYIFIQLDTLNNYQIHKINNQGGEGKNGGLNGDLYIKIFIGSYFLVKDDFIFDTSIKINEDEIKQKRKVINFNNSKKQISFDDKDIQEDFITLKDFGLITNKNTTLPLKVINFSKNKYTYKISINANKLNKTIYLEDYKHFFYENVSYFLNNNNLKDYLEIDLKAVKRNQIYLINDHLNNDIYFIVKGGKHG